MDLHEAIAGRRAVRQYTAESLDKDTIRRLIGAAVLAPSAINEQPWVFTVVSDQALLDRASREVKAHVRATMSASAYAGRLKGERPVKSFWRRDGASDDLDLRSALMLALISDRVVGHGAD